MKTCTITLLLFVINALSLAAGDHNSSISGIVRNQQTQLELAGATVELIGHNQMAFTNELGYFSFSRLPAQEYTIRISFLGFKTITQAGIKVTDDATQPIRIALNPTQIDLPSIEVQAPLINPFTTLAQLDQRVRSLQNGQELLTLAPGLFLAQHAGGGKAEQIFLRGFDIDHGTDLTISVDGIPGNMVSHAHGQGYADMHFVIPEIIEEVTIRKGPYEATDGNFATAGALAMQTTNRLDHNFIQAAGDQYSTYRLATGLNLTPNNNSNTQAYLAGSGMITDGYFESPQNFHRLSLFGKVHHSFAGQRSLTASLSTFSSQWDASGQIPQRAVDQGLITRFGAIDDTEGGQTNRTNVNLIYNQQLGPNSSLEQQLYYSRYFIELYSNFTFFARDPERGDQIRQREERHLAGYRTQYNYLGFLADLPFSAKLGTQLRWDRIKDNELSYTQNRSTTLERVQLGDVQELNGGLFAEGELWLTDRLHAQAGLRVDGFRFQYQNQLAEQYDVQSTEAGIISPKLSLFFDATFRWQFFVRAGSGFHSNDTRVILNQEVKKGLPRAVGYEAGSVFRLGKRLIGQVNLWRLISEQEFVYVGDEGIVEPSGRSKRQGIEALFRWQIGKNLFIDSDLTYTHARSGDTESANYIPLSPIWTGTGGISYRPAQGWQVAFRYRHLGDRPANEQYSLTATGYTLIDATVGFQAPQFYIGLRAENILNTDWNEAQFATTSRLANEIEPLEEIHFTPGVPFRLTLQSQYRF